MSVTADLGYGLPNDWDQAQRRFELLAACHDAASQRRAAALGVGPGWRCLDAGAGQGSFARWLASQVGARGHVVAADLDVTLMADLDAAANVEVRQTDLTTDELPRAAFDLVHTRLALIHIADRDELLPRLAAAVRPGGVLLLEEDDSYPVLATATGDYRAGWDVFLQAMTGGGTDGEWARDLPERLGALGLVGVDAEVRPQFFRGGSDPARFWSLTWLQARERAVSIGADVQALDRGRAILEDPARWFHGPAMIAAWGRRPG